MMMIPRIKKLAEMQNSTILAFSEEKEVFSLYFAKEMRILFLPLNGVKVSPRSPYCRKEQV